MRGHARKKHSALAPPGPSASSGPKALLARDGRAIAPSGSVIRSRILAFLYFGFFSINALAGGLDQFTDAIDQLYCFRRGWSVCAGLQESALQSAAFKSVWIGLKEPCLLFRLATELLRAGRKSRNSDVAGNCHWTPFPQCQVQGSRQRQRKSHIKSGVRNRLAAGCCLNIGRPGVELVPLRLLAVLAKME